MTPTEKLAEALRQCRKSLVAIIDGEGGIGLQAPEVMDADEALAAYESALAATPAAPAYYIDPLDVQERKDSAIVKLASEWHEGLRFKTPLYTAPVALTATSEVPSGKASDMPAAPLTWEQFVLACEAEYGQDFHDPSMDGATEEEKQEMMRVVRMVERAHGIGPGKESSK